MTFILAFWLGYTLPKLLLSWLQMRHVKRFLNKEAIILEAKEYREAGEYALAKERLSLLETLLEGALFGAWIYGGLALLERFSALENHPFASAILFLLGFVLLGAILSLPLEAYRRLGLDRRFGFTQGGVGLFAVDKLKSLALTLLLGGAIFAALVWILESFREWWLFGFLFAFALVLLINLFYPTLIAPLFNRFTPLENPALEGEIARLMQKAGFKAEGVFVMDASRRDGRLNAYFGGLGKSKRVVLFDTLLEKVGERELLAILGHELGHFRHGDLYKNLAFVALLLFALFYIAGNLPASLFEAAGIAPSASATIALLLLISAPLSFWLMPLFGTLSRHNEYAADEFGAHLEDASALARALVALVNENRAFPHSHPAYIFFYYTHPPLVERLKALGYFDER